MYYYHKHTCSIVMICSTHRGAYTSKSNTVMPYNCPLWWSEWWYKHSLSIQWYMENFKEVSLLCYTCSHILNAHFDFIWECRKLWRQSVLTFRLWSGFADTVKCFEKRVCLRMSAISPFTTAPSFFWNEDSNIPYSTLEHCYESTWFARVGSLALLLGSIILIGASIPKKSAWFRESAICRWLLGKPSAVSLDRSSLIFSGFRNSVVSFRLTARGLV